MAHRMVVLEVLVKKGPSGIHFLKRGTFRVLRV